MRALALACIALAGCVSNPALPVVEHKSKVHIDAALLERCPGFEDIVSNPQPSDVLAAHASNVTQMKTCLERHQALSNVVRSAFNLSE